jgi:hypothetical protein
MLFYASVRNHLKKNEKKILSFFSKRLLHKLDELKVISPFSKWGSTFNVVT